MDKNILFQDSVHLFSFEQSNCVQAAYSLFLLLRPVWFIFQGLWGRWRLIHLFGAILNCIIVHCSLDNTHICFLKWAPQHRNGNSYLVHFSMNTTVFIFLTAQVVNPWFPLQHPISVQIFYKKLCFCFQRIQRSGDDSCERVCDYANINAYSIIISLKN